MKQLFTRLVASRRARLATTLTVAVSLPLAAVIGGGAASGQPTAAHTDSGTKPTIVLVHGGWADSSGWNSVISRLTRAGYPVIAPANPLRGLTSDSDYIRSVLQTHRLGRALPRWRSHHQRRAWRADRQGTRTLLHSHLTRESTCRSW